MEKCKCKNCGKVFQPNTSRHTICSLTCNKATVLKQKFLKERNCKTPYLVLPNTPCEVCGWAKTVDIHHHNGSTFILCPNHHALLTRNIRQIEDYFPSERINKCLQHYRLKP